MNDFFANPTASTDRRSPTTARNSETQPMESVMMPTSNHNKRPSIIPGGASVISSTSPTHLVVMERRPQRPASRSVGDHPTIPGSPMLAGKARRTIHRLRSLEKVASRKNLSYEAQMKIFALIRQFESLIDVVSRDDDDDVVVSMNHHSGSPPRPSQSVLSGKDGAAKMNANVSGQDSSGLMMYQNQQYSQQSNLLRQRRRPALQRSMSDDVLSSSRKRLMSPPSRPIGLPVATASFPTNPQKPFRIRTSEQGSIASSVMSAGLGTAQKNEHEEHWRLVACEAFDRYDRDGDGYLDENEMWNAVCELKENDKQFGRSFGTNDPTEYVRSVMEEADTSGDGKISRLEFLDLMGLALFAPSSSRLSNRWKGAQQFARKVFLDQQRSIEANVIGSDNLIHPLGLKNVLFNVLVSIMSYILIFTLPLSLGWVEYAMVFLPLNITTELVFMLDFAKKFFTGCVDEKGRVVLDKQRVRSILLNNWMSLALDFLGSLPFDLIFLLGMIMYAHGSVSVTKIFLRCLKILRSLKFLAIPKKTPTGKLTHWWKNFCQSFDAWTGFSIITIAKTIKILYWTLLLSHWIGCLQFMLVRLHDFPMDSWVVQAGLAEEPSVVQWKWSIYKALAQLINIGFEAPPFTNTTCDSLSDWCQIEHWLTLFCLYLGVGLYTYLLSSMLFVLETSNLCRKTYEERLSELEVFMKQRRLDPSLKESIREYFYLKHPRRTYCNDTEVLRALPPYYIRIIQEHLCADLKVKTPILQDNTKFANILGSSLVERLVVKGEILFREHAPSDGMYFIDDGIVELVSEGSTLEDDRVVFTIGPGCFFGESSIVKSSKRTMTARTATHCTLFHVDKSSFLAVLECFPDVYQRVVQCAEGRYRRLQHARNPTSTAGILLPRDEGGDEEDSKTSFFVRKKAEASTGMMSMAGTGAEVV